MMSEAKTLWTPGPWRWDKNLSDGGAPMIVARDVRRESPMREALGAGPRQRQIAKALFDDGSDDPEVHANARLIASAPELYAALEAEHQGLDWALATIIDLTYKLSGEIFLPSKCGHWPALANGFAAMAKARGEPLSPEAQRMLSEIGPQKSQEETA